MSSRPKVGVAIYLQNAQGMFLVGKRKGSHGNGTWAFPGGHLEYGESIIDCAKRELLEETGVNSSDILNIKEIGYTNDIFDIEKKHYITILVEVLIKDNVKIMNLEPDKCDEWRWTTVTNLPMPLFTPLENFINKYLTTN
jgi:8-oxo-dGTP diphosphatase